MLILDCAKKKSTGLPHLKCNNFFILHQIYYLLFIFHFILPFSFAQNPDFPGQIWTKMHKTPERPFLLIIKNVIIFYKKCYQSESKRNSH